MALPSNVIINIPILAMILADAPLDKDKSFFEVEILTMTEQGTITIGVADKDFEVGQQLGSVNHSFGFRVADGSVHTSTEMKYNKNAISCVGDKIGCGLEFSDSKQSLIYFTLNGKRVFQFSFVDTTTPVFPCITMMTPKEEVRLLQDLPWRSGNPEADNHASLKLCRETGQLSFRSTKEGGRVSTLLANNHFSKQFAYFEIEILALGPKDEISIGGVSENYSLRKLPGHRPRSLGFFGQVGGIFSGTEVKRDEAPKCSVGDKMGCGIDHRDGRKRFLYFTHNSKSFMEAELNDNCPANLFPAIGLQSHGSTISVCLLDSSRWGSADDDVNDKPTQVDMTSQVVSEPGVMVVDKETARASFTAPVGVTSDAFVIASKPLSPDVPYFEIEILYGSVLTIGLVPSDVKLAVHPGWSNDSIGYNADSGQVYTDGQVADNDVKSKCTYGDRMGCGIKWETTEGKQFVYVTKNGMKICELPFGDGNDKLFPAVGMRSAGQVLAVRLLDRRLWSCDVVETCKSESNSGMMTQMFERELIECPICRDVFSDPRILPCSVHTFCSACLEKYIEQHHGKKSVPCPICQRPFVVPSGGVSELPSNSLIARLLEIHSKLTTN